MTTMTTDDDDGDGDGDGGAIDVYYDAGVFFTSARASVDSAAAPPVEATTTPTAMDAKAARRIPPVERRRVLAWTMATRTRRRRRGRTTDDAFHDGDVLGREVGRRWEGGRVSDVSDDNAGGGDAAMTEDETPRFSNVRHRSQGNDDRAPDSTTILPPPPSPPSYCDRRSHGCILHPTTTRTSTATNSNSRHRTHGKVDWGSNPTINICGVVPRRTRQRDQRMPTPRRHGGPVHNALKLLTDRSRRRSNNVEGGEGARGAWLLPRRSRTSWEDRCRRPPDNTILNLEWERPRAQKM